MDFSDADRQTLQNVVRLIWAKGTHNPDEGMVALQFTQLVQRVIQAQAPKAAEEPKTELLKKV